MNDTERSYGEYLALRRAAGEVAWYGFESMKLRLADRTHFTPDYLVVLADGLIELREVKGRKGDRPYVREDAMLKIKVAAEQYQMFKFFIVWPRRGGGWNSEEI